jgi:hypothetical protein
VAAQTSPPDAPPVRHAPPGAEGVDLMGGLVLGITVRRPLAYEAGAQPTRRRFELYIPGRERVFGTEPAYAFVLASSAAPRRPIPWCFPATPSF